MSLFDDSGKLISPYAGKAISILGDSISAFAGYVPSGNAVYYTGTNAGVMSVNDLWWKKLTDALGASVLINEAWSGSRVTTTNGETSAGCMTRCTNLHSGSEDPDVIIVYLGINDFINGVGLGTYRGADDFPTVTITFREAYAIMLDKILTITPIRNCGSVRYPTVNVLGKKCSRNVTETVICWQCGMMRSGKWPICLA